MTFKPLAVQKLASRIGQAVNQVVYNVPAPFPALSTLAFRLTRLRRFCLWRFWRPGWSLTPKLWKQAVNRSWMHRVRLLWLSVALSCEPSIHAGASVSFRRLRPDPRYFCRYKFQLSSWLAESFAPPPGEHVSLPFVQGSARRTMSAVFHVGDWVLLPRRFLQPLLP